MGRGRLSTLTKESVKVDLPWSTWAMTDMLRIFRFLSIKARISSTVKLTYEPTTINDWRKEREKNKFYKSRLHNTYSTKQEKSKGTSKATHLFLCVCLTRINFVCFVQNIPRHFVFFPPMVTSSNDITEVCTEKNEDFSSKRHRYIICIIYTRATDIIVITIHITIPIHRNFTTNFTFSKFSLDFHT